MDRAPRFIVDSNVGRLAKWLRALGYDSLFIDPIADENLVSRALAEGRVVLTKDTHLSQRRAATQGRLRVLLLEGDDFRAQLRQVVRALQLDPSSRRFSLCLECNESLVPKAKEEVEGLVPPYVFQTQHHYRFCPRCGRPFWRGTHWQRMNGELDKLVEAS